MPADTDRIETDLLIAAPIERVWALVTTAEHLGRWFGNAGATVDLRPGGALSLTWAGHGTVHGRVEEVEPPHRFAFRWHARPGVDTAPTPATSTLATFSLAAEGQGTRVTVVERGFDALDADPDARIAALADHTSGWRTELGHLADHAAATAGER